MRPDLRTVSGVLALVVAVQACGDPQASAEAYSVSDSAGIHIIVNRLPLKPVGTWAVSHAPTVLVGSDESDEMHNLHRVAGAVVLSDDRIVVAHGPEPMLRWYSPDGEFLIGAGRPGGGPGEFGDGEGAWIYAVWPLEGDSVATWEHGPRRMQVFDPEGRYARYLVIDLPPDMPVGTYPQMAGRSQTGFVAYLYLMSGPGGLGEKRRDDFLYLAYAADGKYRRSLARLPGFESFTMEVHLPGRPEPLRSQGRPPFSRLPLSWVHGDRFYYGSSYYFEVAVYDLDGEMTQLVRREVAREPVTSAMISDYKKQFSTTSESAPRMVPGVDDLPYPDSLPPYRRLWVDREGWLWIQRYDAPSDTVVTWSVFNPNGRWETDVVVPRTWQIQDIGMDYVLALIRDDLDIERIGRFALSRRE